MWQLTKNHINRSITIVAIAVFSLFIFWISPVIKNQLNRWEVLPKPENLSELYFTEPNNLPSTYVPGRTQRVNFTLKNLEHQTITYHYTIVEKSLDGRRQQVLTSNSIILEQNHSQSISYTSPLSDMGNHVTVEVEVPTVHESIDYLIARSET